ncbi:MAG: hypothetical protein LBK52_04680, partial [Deltaproteobacteria bacterium]|nr:hypothetical protein [Deltaproteobacteria bacterium]
EAIVTWQPEVIFTSGPADRLEILKDPALAQIPAVRSGRVYACPRGIFPWYARSAEGALLPLWFGTQLYPEEFKDVDMKVLVREYFAEFYNYQIPEDELAAVLSLESPETETRP